MKRVFPWSTLSSVAMALALMSAGVGVTAFRAANAEAREPANASAVIGKPFRISESVKEYCEMAPKIPMCEHALPLLAAMKAEPRDPEWAAPMEALIEKSMRVGGKEWAEIRALECRRTRCALEYAVSVDDLAHDVDGSEELERLMDALGGIVAPEVNKEMGKSRMVSVVIWQKRS